MTVDPNTAADPNAAASPATSVPAIPPASPASSVRFVGDSRTYWRLLIRGAALLAVTLGIYRFWFATDVRRFLWSNTEVAGETLEYTGTAYELLIGFLIALALLVPLYVGLAIAALAFGTVGQIAGVLSFPLLAFLGQFAVYRARRYRLTRTVYRGVRFHQDGSALRFALCAMIWWTLTALTLGLAYPFAQSRLERFKMRHTYYGNLLGRFEGSGLRLFARGLPMWAVTMGPLLFALIYAVANVEWDKLTAAAEAAGSASEFINQLESVSPHLYTAIVISITAISVSILMATILFPVFQAMMMRWWMSGLRFGTLTVRSHLRTGAIYGAYLRLLWYGLLFATAVGIAAGVLFTSVGEMVKHFEGPAEVVGAVGGLITYVVMMLGYSAIYQGTVKFALWRHGAESVELEGVAALDAVTAEGTPSSAVGEGLADALNVGGF